MFSFKRPCSCFGINSLFLAYNICRFAIVKHFSAFLTIHTFLHAVDYFNPGPAEHAYVLPLQTVLKNPTDLDLHCLPLSM